MRNTHLIDQLNLDPLEMICHYDRFFVSFHLDLCTICRHLAKIDANVNSAFVVGAQNKTEEEETKKYKYYFKNRSAINVILFDKIEETKKIKFEKKM